jgi:arsenate reductase-like glutaredoxin family protein
LTVPFGIPFSFTLAGIAANCLTYGKDVITTFKKANDKALRPCMGSADMGAGMRFFGLKTCDTCRKALAAVRAEGLEPQVIDVRADGIAPADLERIVAAFGDRAINRASATWRGLSEEERALDPVSMLAAHPTVMKRPVIDHDGVWFIGWDKAVQAAVLGPR